MEIQQKKDFARFCGLDRFLAKFCRNFSRIARGIKISQERLKCWLWNIFNSIVKYLIFECWLFKFLFDFDWCIPSGPARSCRRMFGGRAAEANGDPKKAPAFHSVSTYPERAASRTLLLSYACSEPPKEKPTLSRKTGSIVTANDRDSRQTQIGRLKVRVLFPPAHPFACIEIHEKVCKCYRLRSDQNESIPCVPWTASMFFGIICWLSRSVAQPAVPPA